MQSKRPSLLCRVLLVAFSMAALALCVWAKDFVKPAAHDAKTYPAHDDHPDEKVAIAADPYETAEKAKIFPANLRDHGLLPIFFVITNDGGQPVSIANLQVTLTTGDRAKLTPVASQDIYRRLSNPQGETRPERFPVPHRKVKGAVSQQEMDDIESSQFAAKAIEPHNTQSGFLYFDVSDIASPLAGAHIFVTGVDDAKGAELMFFDISVDKYLNAPPPKN